MSIKSNNSGKSKSTKFEKVDTEEKKVKKTRAKKKAITKKTKK